MILDMVTFMSLRQCKIHCRRVLITDPIAHVTDAIRIFGQNQLSDAKSCEMRQTLTSFVFAECC